MLASNLPMAMVDRAARRLDLRAVRSGMLVMSLFVVAMCVLRGFEFAALNVRYRDIRYVIPFLVQVWLFVSPVAYSAGLVPPAWRTVYALNPMAGVVDGFRWAFVGAEAPGRELAVSVASGLVLLVLGLFAFRRLEDSFADEI